MRKNKATPIKDFDISSILLFPSNVIEYNKDIILCDNLEKELLVNNVVSTFGNMGPKKITYNMLLFCLEGSLKIRINLIDYEITKGEQLIATPNSFGELIYISNNLKCFLIIYKESIIDNINSVISIAPDTMNEIKEIYFSMRRRISTSNNLITGKILRSYITIIECYSNEQLINVKNNNTNIKISRQQYIYNKFMELVKRDYLTERNITHYAQQLCITPKYLSRIIYKLSGRYAGDWIKDYVILEAKTMLLTNEYTVQQIADTLNFANASFFGKYFKAAVGVSPKQYILSTKNS